MPFKYNEIEREDWIKSMAPNYVLQNWHNDIVYHPDHIIHKEFFRQTTIQKEYISPSKICGIEYFGSYNCPAHKSKDWRLYWIEMLHQLKRLDSVIDSFKSRQSLITHIHNNKDLKCVMQFGDHYITTSGQHRLCLAKFLELDEVLVSVQKYELDRDLFRRELNIERNVPFLTQNGFINSNYTRSLNSYSHLYLKGDKETVVLKKEFIHYLIHRFNILKDSPYKRWQNVFRDNKIKNGYLYIEKEEDLYLLDRIIKQKISSISKNK